MIAQTMPIERGVAAERRTRLAIFTTHPIQYQAPWFRALSVVPTLDVEVVFSYRPEADEQGKGFGKGFRWDIPLLEGYRHRTLAAARLAEATPAIVRRWALGIAGVLDDIRPDAVLILGWQELSLVRALLACKRRGIRVIMRGESNALKPRPLAATWLHRGYLSLCDGFLAIGESNAQFYRNAGVASEKIRVAGYCVDNARFAEEARRLRRERAAIRQAWSIPADKSCFAFVGKLEAKKRVRTFLEGLHFARRGGADVHGLVVGTGADMANAVEFVEANRLPVSFAGFLNQSEIAKAYVAADAIVLPSDFGETWGLVVNEAMATGLPAIVSDRVGCANDLVIDGETGLVVPFADVHALGAAVARLATDAAERFRMGGNAVRRVNSRFSIDGAVVQTVALLSTVVDHGRA